MNAAARTSDVVDSNHIADASEIVGSRFRIIAPDLKPSQGAVRGDYRLVRLRDGFVLHASDTVELYNLTTEIVQREGITCSLFLAGSAEVTLGDRSIGFGRDSARASLEGVVVSRARPEIFRRRSKIGKHIRKVNVTIAPQWLESAGLQAGSGENSLAQLFNDHLAVHRWRASARIASLAEQILRPPAYSPVLQHLYCETRAIEIVAEALQAVAGSDASISSVLRPKDYQRLQHIRDFIDSHVEETFTLEMIAREAGMSVNTLQRLFRATLDVTVFEYIRGRKLNYAREALEREGISIAEAAYLAGYNSASNFATAFRRTFGIAPKNVRATLHSSRD